uniref:Osteocalcin n=1 Tax=Otus sunia TaxID=257818 RepID=A0A8C8B0B6_9STRI
MKPLVLLSLLALLTLGLCRRAPPDRPPPRCVPTAFISKRASAELARRHKRNYRVCPPRAKREVCEFNPACDELADHIGFQEAYRRFYGPV